MEKHSQLHLQEKINIKILEQKWFIWHQTPHQELHQNLLAA
jgi:hypothetical protein